ncbi:MAG: ATP-dependent DNA helicase RecG [Succinivibrionaceae bacterium]|nr:ATP-dependent DNA helicase RecG [Succinivibrionaceae bacterium]
MRADEAYYHQTHLGNIPGVGERVAAQLSRIGLDTWFDLLLHLPFRYLDKTRLTPIGDLLEPGRQVMLGATVTSAVPQVRGKMRLFKVGLSDQSGSVEAVFFNTRPYFERRFAPGQPLLCFGTFKYDPFGKRVMQHPEVVFLAPGESPAAHLSRQLTPVYHLTGAVKQRNMEKIVGTALARLRGYPLPELLPPGTSPGGLGLCEAIAALHAPQPCADGRLPHPEELPAFKRVCFEELTAYQAALGSLKRFNLDKRSVPIPTDPDAQGELIAALPFTPTAAQLRVFGEIMGDLGRDSPMLRLLQGDVGSGKTLVAAMVALQVARAGRQCAMLAPTELLAEQHFRSLEGLLAPRGVQVALLRGALRKSEREAALRDIAAGSAQVVVGTHSVFQPDVAYHDLAVALIDEQHRFGVDQRLALLGKAREGMTMHQLVMTATPIPRTSQLALYADLDVSAIDEMPKGRVPIITSTISSDRRAQVIAHLRDFCAQGKGQAYWVCPLIDENGEDRLTAATTLLETLRAGLPGIGIGLLHGQMPQKDKQQAMQDFLKGKTQVLVATTIVEVGVDVRRARIMIIENADCLGLAQLHQLRGRVGRGSEESYCILLFDRERLTPIGEQRLMAIRSTQDGFKIAREDLRLRGPGEIIGTRQAGFDTFHVADPLRDQELVESSHEAARTLLERYPQEAFLLIERWFPQFAPAISGNTLLGG